MKLLEERELLRALQDVQDPELPISIVDMGLVVDLKRQDAEVHVAVTFTAMGCPGMDMILDDIRHRLLQEPGVEHVKVEVVWEPVWTKDRLSEEGKAQMREWGISL